MAWLVNITARAEHDFASLYEEVYGADSAAAASWYARLKKAVLSLEDMPHRCPVVRKSGQIRQLLYGRKPHVYLVLFRIREKQKEVDILHIRHGARRPLPASELLPSRRVKS